MSALDGRAPFVLDVRELGRRAGAMLTLAITQPAPADLHNPMIGVPEGSDVAMNLMAESVIEGVLITARLASEQNREVFAAVSYTHLDVYKRQDVLHAVVEVAE